MIHPVKWFPSYQFDFFKKLMQKLLYLESQDQAKTCPYFDERPIFSKKMYKIKCFQSTSVVMEDVCKWQSHNKYIKCVIKYQVKYEKYEQVEFTDWYEDKQMFFQLYIQFTRTQMMTKWVGKMRFLRQSGKKLQLNTLLFPTNKNSSPAVRFSNY